MFQLSSLTAEAIVLICLGLLVAVPILVAILAVILQTACSLAGAPPPEFLRAVGVVVVQLLVEFAFLGCLITVLYFAIDRIKIDKVDRELASYAVLSCVGLPFLILSTVVVYSMMLRGVTFFRAILVGFVELFIVLLIGLLLTCVISAVVVGVNVFNKQQAQLHEPWHVRPAYFSLISSPPFQVM